MPATMARVATIETPSGEVQVWGCQHAQEMFFAHPGMALFSTLSYSHHEWFVVYKPGKSLVMIDCSRCCGSF